MLAVPLPLQLMRTEQAKYVARFVRAKRSGQGTPKGGYPHLSSFKQDAPWRGQAASEKQLAVLTRLGVRAAACRVCLLQGLRCAHVVAETAWCRLTTWHPPAGQQDSRAAHGCH